jgi:DNA repair photolyase
MNVFIKALELKDRLLKDLGSVLDDSSKGRALRDSHVRRRPRPCGITIHTGIGCPFKCSYCYIYSMGFPDKILKYPLSVPELVYAIISNPYFIPGNDGTLLALGSVTEPLHPIVVHYTIELLKYIHRHTRNPVQLATKVPVSQSISSLLREASPSISILVTIVTLKYDSVLEPHAPPAYSRLESLSTLVDGGLHTSLFLRPIIPGVTDFEIKDILMETMKRGVNNVVFGSLRINKDIINRLRDVDIDLYNNILRYVDFDIPEKKQVYLKTGDLKSKMMEAAKEMHFRVFPSACAANMDSVGLSCYMCKFGPCGDIRRLLQIDEDDVVEFIEFFNLRCEDVDVNESYIRIRLGSPYRKGVDINVLRYYLSIISKRFTRFI